jgi:hypothetical protein
MKKIYFILLTFIIQQANASIGDTTIVRSHNKVDQTWNGNYDRLAKFPDGTQSFSKIYMEYTLSCPSSGCSDWDYDVNISLLHNTGKIDTVVSRIDTLSTSPLVTDTIWKYNKVYNPFEMGRYITPYGSYMNKRNAGYGTAGFDSNWRHTFIYDVTDFAMLLKDSVLIRSNYRGWSSGFQCTIDFVFVEGTPARKVLSIQNLYTSGGTYTTTEEFESKRMPGKKLAIPANAKDASLKVIITGHGADKNNGCGEFCDKLYFLKVNDQVLDTVRMWRDDCGITAVKPQGGTWIFDRANWCPGDKIYPFFHPLKKFLIPGDSLLLDIDLDPSIYTGNNAASYNASAILFVYDDFAFSNDATISDILSPSNASEYKHWNPICNEPKVILQNLGSKPLTWANIVYGVQGQNRRTYVWKGYMASMEQDTITLPTPFWDGVNFTSNIFEVSVLQANHQFTDENTFNNTCRSVFSAPPRLEPFTLMMRTNGQPQENKLTITNEKGAEVFKMDNLDPNKIYQYDLDLPAGCYELLLTDQGKDGLHFWYYAQTGQPTRTNGWFRLNKKGGGSYLLPSGDFGTEIRYNFVVGNMDMPEATIIRDELRIFPNPASDKVNVQIPQKTDDNLFGLLSIKVIDLNGKLIKEVKNIPANDAYWHSMPVIGISPGMYIIEAELEYTGFERTPINQKMKTKLMITH